MRLMRRFVGWIRLVFFLVVFLGPLPGQAAPADGGADCPGISNVDLAEHSRYKRHFSFTEPHPQCQGYDYRLGGFDRSQRAHRQPGSAFKPFIYATAIDSKRYTAASVVNDSPEVFKLWKPQNHDAKFLGGEEATPDQMLLEGHGGQ